MENKEEQQYLELIEKILQDGSLENGRNGETYSLFGEMMRFSLNNGQVPFLTTKKLAWKTCFKELMWFIQGKTDNSILKKKGVNIWNANGSKEFLESRGLDYEEDDLGPIYGFQWRHFNAKYQGKDADYSDQGIDQLKNIVTILKDPSQRSSRRIILTAWNPLQIDKMALPPCHVMAQFHVKNDRYLSCALFQRSGDVGLGVPFNIASYSLLTHLLAHHCGLIADSFVHFIGNCHIYMNHKEALEEQIKRNPYPFPKIKFNTSIKNLEEYDLEDIEFIEPYKYHPTIKMEMSA